MFFHEKTGAHRAIVQTWDGAAWTTLADPGYELINGAIDLVVADDTPYITFKDRDADQFKPVVLAWSGGAWSTVGPAWATDGNDDTLSLAAAPGVLYLGYRNDLPDDETTVQQIGR